jgi:hypothetical protein
VGAAAWTGAALFLFAFLDLMIESPLITLIAVLAAADLGSARSPRDSSIRPVLGELFAGVSLGALL